MARVLRDKGLSLGDRVRLKTGERGRIEIVSEIEPHRTHRCLITHPYPDGVRNITEVTLRRSAFLHARLGILLLPAQQIVKHVMTIRKNVSRIMKNREAQVLLEKRQCRWRHPKLQIIKEKRAAT